MKNKFNIYLDIDGVLLKKDGSLPWYAEKFISFLTGHFNCFWLTTHCRSGENKALAYLSKYYPPAIISKLELVQTAYWDTLKTEAIDFETDFFWFDDYVLEIELKVLRNHKKINRLILINHNTNYILQEVLEHVRNEIKKQSGQQDRIIDD